MEKQHENFILAQYRLGSKNAIRALTYCDDRGSIQERTHGSHSPKDTGGEIEGLYPKLENLGVTTTKIPMTAVAHGNLVSRYLSDLSYVKNAMNG